jgi:TPR repeat protein
MYHKGEGVPQDGAEAVKWYRRAAEQGHRSARYNLGQMYLFGDGVPQDHAEAVRWLRLAAEQGHPGAQYNLGISYFNGDGVPQDYVSAHKWLNLAALRYQSGADRDRAAAARDSVADRMTAAEVAEAQGMTREWTAKP